MVTITPISIGTARSLPLPKPTDRERYNRRHIRIVFTVAKWWCLPSDLALDVSPFFEDVNNDLLTYSALSSDETVATVTVTVSSSMVTITPISIGTAIITVTADDGNDGTVGQTFNAVVQAAQAPPTAKDTITTQNLTVGTIGTLDVSPYFDDVNNDPLTYSALSSDDAIATVAINTNTATISPISDGTATITVTADDGNSGTGGRHCRPDFPSRSGQSTAHRRCRPGPKRG